MAALATSADVEASLGRSLTSTEEERLDRLLAGASALARRITRRSFEAGDYTVRRIVRAGRVVIPEEGTVTAVRTISRIGEATTLDTDAYTVRGTTIYGLDYACEVEVDFTTTADTPADVVGAVADMVAAVFQAPAAHVQSESAGPFTVRYRTEAGTVAAAGSVLETLKMYAAPPLGPILL